MVLTAQVWANSPVLLTLGESRSKYALFPPPAAPHILEEYLVNELMCLILDIVA